MKHMFVIVAMMGFSTLYSNYDLICYEKDHLYGNNLFDSSAFFLDAILVRNSFESMSKEDAYQEIENFFSLHARFVLPAFQDGILNVDTLSSEDITLINRTNLDAVKHTLEKQTNLSFENIGLLVASYDLFRRKLNDSLSSPSQCSRDESHNRSDLKSESNQETSEMHSGNRYIFFIGSVMRKCKNILINIYSTIFRKAKL